MLFVVFLEICNLSHQVFAVVLLHNWGSGQKKETEPFCLCWDKASHRDIHNQPFTNAFSLDADLGSSVLVASVCFFKKKKKISSVMVYGLNKILIFMWLLF